MVPSTRRLDSVHCRRPGGPFGGLLSCSSHSLGASVVLRLRDVNRIGVGVVTYQRPDLYRVCAASIVKHLGWADWLGAAHDGPDPGGYDDSPLPVRFYPHRGVGATKNELLSAMLAADIDWLFVGEDDLEVLSPLACLGYIEACQESGFEALAFHGHGYWKPPVAATESVEMFDNFCGIWTCFSRNSLEVGGLIDPAFCNSFEHVEHSLRLAKLGFTSPWRQAADAAGSEAWLREQPGSHDLSIIARDPETGRHAEEGRAYWKQAHPETWPADLG